MCGKLPCHNGTCTTVSIELVPSECVEESHVFGEVLSLTNVVSLSRLTVLPCLDWWYVQDHFH